MIQLAASIREDACCLFLIYFFDEPSSLIFLGVSDDITCDLAVVTTVCDLKIASLYALTQAADGCVETRAVLKVYLS